MQGVGNEIPEKCAVIHLSEHIYIQEFLFYTSASEKNPAKSYGLVIAMGERGGSRVKMRIIPHIFEMNTAP